MRKKKIIPNWIKKVYAVPSEKGGTDIYKDEKLTKFYCHIDRRFRVEQIIDINCWPWHLIPVKNAVQK